MTSSPPDSIADRLDSASLLDAPARAIGRVVRGAIPDGAPKTALSGRWLGHALHPVLTDLPIGTFTSALVLDLLGGRDAEDAADKLVAVGLATTPGTILTGWSDWADAEQANAGARRSGVVHAVLNATAVGFMAASYAARKRGDRGRGKRLTLVGMSLLSGGGWLGGHLSYNLGVGVDRAAPATGAQAAA